MITMITLMGIIIVLVIKAASSVQGTEPAINPPHVLLNCSTQKNQNRKTKHI